MMPDAAKLSAPRIYLIRAAIFLVLISFLVLVLQRRIIDAFLTNPGLNGLIVGVLFIGILLALRGIWQLFREVDWVNASHLTGEGVAIAPPPVLLAPMAAVFGDRLERASASTLTLRAMLDSLAARLDESRDIGRYLAGLLVFLGLLGTFWGLLETVSSIGGVIGTLRTTGDTSALFDDLKTGLAAPLSGMGISFSSSLFGLAGSLILGFLDLQMGQAQNRFFTELEDLLAQSITEIPTIAPSTIDERSVHIAAEHKIEPPQELTRALDKLTLLVSEQQSNRAATQAMADLAEGIQGLVAHMRTEQRLMREYLDNYSNQQNEIKRLLQRLSSPPSERID